MKDQRGFYYYPFPANKRVRMYVREKAGEVEFRMWNQDDSELWKQHGWLPYSAVEQATSMYRQSQDGFDPGKAYDVDLAWELVRPER